MLRWPKFEASSPEPLPEPPGRRDDGAALSVVKRLSKSISNVGKDAAEVRGALEDTQRVVEAQGQAMQALSRQLGEIGQAQAAMATATAQSAAAMQRARNALGVVGGEVVGMATTLSQVSNAAAEITKISLQTRLVAFNAAVEAKHAGEAGRGFAVVAQEVRALAQRSADAAKEIKSLIQSSSQAVARGVDLVGATGAALNEIVDEVEDVARRVEDIAAAAAEQSASLAEVNRALSQLENVTGANAGGADGTHAASQSLIHEARRLAGLLDHFIIPDEVLAGVWHDHAA